MSKSESSINEVNLIKTRLVDTSLVVSVIAGLPLIVISIARAIKFAQLDLALLNSAVYAMLLLVTFFRKRIAYHLKALAMIVLMLLVGLSDFYEIGLFSFGYAWLIGAAIFAFIYFTLRYSIIVILFSTLTVALIKYLSSIGFIVYQQNLSYYLESDMAILLRVLTFILISLVLVFSIRHITNSLNKSVKLLESQKKDLMDTAEQMRQEIKQRKKTAQEAKDHESYFRNVFERSSNPILIINKNGVVLDHNPAMMGIVEEDLDNLTGTRIHEIIPFEYGDFFRQYEDDFTDLPGRMELSYRSKITGKKYYIDLSTSVINYNNEKALLAVLHDNTSQINRERIIYSAALEAEEKERLRLSKELHDGLGPLLSTLKIYFEVLDKKADDKRIKERIALILEDSINSVKEISNNLSPYVLQNLGVVKALRTFVDKINYTGKIKIILKTNFEKRLNEKLEITIYRLITELVNNTLKHAQAKNASILFDLTQGNLSISYEDDGVGFDAEKVFEKKEGIGLFNMKSRVEKMGGEFIYNTEEGKGFKLKVVLDVHSLN